MIKNTILNFEIKNKEDLKNAVTTIGFLPFFKNFISGFSVEEHIVPECWFADTEGAWEWKGPVIRELGCAYGKFFNKKAAFVSKEWFYDFANYRRNGYDFDAGFDDGFLKFTDKILYEALEENAPVLSKTLKTLGGYAKDGKKGFDSSITSLQTKCYVLISDFVYMIDKHGLPYGWGVAEYSTPEMFFGEHFSNNVYNRTPEESFNKIYGYFQELFPDTDKKTIKKFLG